MAIWISWNIDIPRSLNSRDSFPRRKFENRVPASCRPGTILSPTNHQFWAPRQNGGGDRPRKVQFSQLRRLCDLDLDLRSGRGHTGAHIRSRSTHTPNEIEIRKTFVDLRTDGRTHLSSNLIKMETLQCLGSFKSTGDEWVWKSRAAWCER